MRPFGFTKCKLLPSQSLGWLADNALNGWAYVSLHLVPPLQARRWVERAALLRRPISSKDEARRMNMRLGCRGTCLSRSLAIASRWRGAEVVIGVDPPSNRAQNCVPNVSDDLHAHAWVEIGGVAP